MKAMPIVARTTFVVLVGATFAAFFVAQRLKSAPPVIDVGRISSVFSPNRDGERDVNQISIALKTADDATVDVISLDGDRVRRLADSVAVRPTRPLRLTWDGRSDSGRVVPDGRYQVRVALRREGRSVTVRKSMAVDTRAPASRVCVGFPCSDPQRRLGNIISQGDREVRLYVNGVSRHSPTILRILRTDQAAPTAVASLSVPAGSHHYVWDGRVNGRPLPPGTYIVQAQVRDSAGNLGVTPAEIATGNVPGHPGLTVRGIAAQPPLRPVNAGGRAEFFVDSRGAAYRWRVRRLGDSAILKRGRATAPQLALRAPRGPSGVYLLELSSGRWHTTVPFLVQAAKRSSLLVVVPAISWLGTDKVDDTPFDGIPNTLDDVGASVRWPRVLQGESGLPAGFADQVAPLIVFLDRQHVRYDITSDLDLDLTENPRASDRPGVLLAGSERWVTRSLANRLKRYVSDGGRLAIFGADTLHRTVRLRVHADGDSGTLSRATQPTPSDPFGAYVGRERRTPAPVAVSQYDGDDNDLMTGALSLPGFTRLEESASLGTGKLLAAVGEPLSAQEEAAATQSGKPARAVHPALSEVQLGKGMVIRVGLPEWPQRLHEGGVAQVTRNIFDILRHVAPRIRSEHDR
jgi:flagellar hook assembly protein FlgD